MTSNLRVWEFDRYVRGQLKAEGIRISRATNEEQARRMAAEMAYPGDVLVMRSVPETGPTPQCEDFQHDWRRICAKCGVHGFTVIYPESSTEVKTTLNQGE